MNWGKSIIVSFVLFAAFIATLVTVCMREEVDLVSPHYYQEELAYQEQIVRMQNTASLKQKPVITLNDQNLIIKFDQFADLEKAQVILFCPSNPRHDRTITFPSSPLPEQIIPLSNIQPGMYHVKFLWSLDGKDFYMDQVIQL